MATAAETGLRQTMSGRKGDKQPGNRQKPEQKSKRQQRRENCKGESKTSSEQEGSLYWKGRPQETSDGMAEQGFWGKRLC